MKIEEIGIDKYEWWKNVLFSLRILITISSLILLFLFFKFGWATTYGLIGTVLLIGIPFGSLFLIVEYLIRKKVKREMEDIQKNDDEWLDNYVNNKT